MRHDNGEPPYVVRWSDTGVQGLYFPGPDAYVIKRSVGQWWRVPPTDAMAESVMGLQDGAPPNPAALAADGGPWRGLDDLEIATCAWVSWFNEERIHSELEDKTPAEVEAENRHESQADAA